MKENYIESYVNVDGSLIHRKISNMSFVFVFAGIKYLFDRILAILGLIIFLPLALIIAIAIKLDSKGPVLFKQVRTGKHGIMMYMIFLKQINIQE